MKGTLRVLAGLIAFVAAAPNGAHASLVDGCGVFELVGVPRCEGPKCSQVVVARGTESETVLTLKAPPPKLLLYKEKRAALRVRVTGQPGPFRVEAEILSIDGIARMQGPPGARDPVRRIKKESCPR